MLAIIFINKTAYTLLCMILFEIIFIIKKAEHHVSGVVTMVLGPQIHGSGCGGCKWQMRNLEDLS